MFNVRPLSWIIEYLMPSKVFSFFQLVLSKISSGSTSLEPITIVNMDFNGAIENQIQRISFEISNTCNYTDIHPECPVSCYKKSVILNKDIVLKTLDELAIYEYKGFVSFHRYNEPMINKTRLFSYIEYTNRVLPEAKIIILTNGSYLFEEDLRILEKYKIWSLSVSSYSKSEHFRLKKLKTTIPYQVFYSVLDDRESIYRRKPIDLKLKCFATIRDITVNCYGKVGLCCYDWDNQVTFGNLANESLQKILNSDAFMKTHHELINGERTFDVCRRCDTCR